MEWYCLGISTHKPLILVTCLGKREAQGKVKEMFNEEKQCSNNLFFTSRSFWKLTFSKMVNKTNHFDQPSVFVAGIKNASFWDLHKQLGQCYQAKRRFFKKCFKDGQMNMVSFSGMVMFLKVF